jgi:hypothetical protein
MAFRPHPHLLVLALALTNAVLYSTQLPLWNGFDEPFHYDYVEKLLFTHRPPLQQKTRISAEIQQSLAGAPSSLNFAGAVSIREWSHFSDAEKTRRRAALFTIPSEMRLQSGSLPSYEGQQAPLAYAILTPVDALLDEQPLPVRILCLRFFCGVAATILLYVAVLQLLDVLGVTTRFRAPALLCIFVSQMVWASVAHVGNDAFAVPLTVLFLAKLGRVVKRENGSRTLSLVLTLGLLTKAYFLAFVPLTIALAIWKRKPVQMLLLPLLAALPWYARNVVLYGSVSGTQESAQGIGLREVLSAIPRMPWLQGAVDFIHWSLWTGDWSFLSFSQLTLNLQAALLFGALLFYAARWRDRGEHDFWLLAGCLLFFFGLAYQTCATWVQTHGASTSPEPWYGQGIIVCLWICAFKGLDSGHLPGRVLAIALTLMSSWIAILTYFWKLPPFYAGLIRPKFAELAVWWPTNSVHALETVILGPEVLFYLCLMMFPLLLIAMLARSIAGLWPLAE